MATFGKATGGGRRDDHREAAPLPVLMTTFSTSFTAELVDLSATGARLRCLRIPAIGVELFLTVCRLRTFCTVRWVGTGECGVQFDEPLLQADVVAVRKEAAAGRGLDPLLRAAMDDWVIGIAR